jgi:hypothetical protein
MEQFSAWIGEIVNPQNNYIQFFTLAASFATCISAYFSLKSILQVAALSRIQSMTQKRSSTVSYITDNSYNLSTLSNKAIRLVSQHQPTRNSSDDYFNEHFNLQEYTLPASTKQRIINKIRQRVPLNYTQGIPHDLVNILNETCLINVVINYSRETDRALIDLFNRLEEISNGVNTEIFDVDLVNEMYGGLISIVYLDHIEWIVLTKRKLGFRIYDQFDNLYTLLLERNTEQFCLTKITFLLRLILHSKSGFNLALKVFRNKGKMKHTLNRKQLRKFLIDTSSIDLYNFVCEKSKDKNIRFKEYYFKNRISRRSKTKLKKLFLDSLIASNGEWPVGIVEYRRGRKLKPEDIEDEEISQWVSDLTKVWDYTYIAYNKKFLSTEYIGAISVSTSETLCLTPERFSDEILSAVSSMHENNFDAQCRLLKNAQIPFTVSFGEATIDVSKMALIRSLYVTTQYRDNSNYSIGRKLLRNAISYCRNNLHLIPFLTVLADSEYTEKAISLYVAEGGSFIGTCRDRNDPNGHLMHIFIF